MNDDIFAPETVNNSGPISAEELAAQVDALLGEEAAPAAQEAPAPQAVGQEAPIPQASAAEAAQGYSAPEGYELRYVQTPQGYQPVYMPIAQPAYSPEYTQPNQPPVYNPEYSQPRQPAQSKPRRSSSQPRPAGALRERPRKKPWGKVIGATVLSAVIVAAVIFGVVAGATALIRRMGRSQSHGGAEDFGGSNWGGMGGYDEGPGFIIDEDGNILSGGSGALRVDSSGNIIDENGNIIGSIHSSDGGFVIGPEVDGPSDAYHPIDGENSLAFVKAEGGLNLRDNPEGQRIASIPNGYPVYMLGYQGEWIEVEFQQTRGWVKGDYLSVHPVSQQKLYYVHADGGLNMRAEPTTASARIENIPNGAQLYSLARYDKWVFTFYGGVYGWVHSDYLGSSSPIATQPPQDKPSGGYTMADIEAAMDDAIAYYRSRKGKAPNGGLRGDSLTESQVEALYWKAVGLVVGMEYFPAGQFANVGEPLEVQGGYGIFFQVSDPNIRSMEDWADLFYSTLTDDLACQILCANPMFILDGKMYISGAAMGDEGLITQYTTRVEAEPGGYKFIMDVVNIREDYDTGAQERMEWTFTAHCFQEDGVWVFDKADTPYR